MPIESLPFSSFFVDGCVEKLRQQISAQDKLVLWLTDPPGDREQFLSYMHELDNQFEIVWIFADIYKSLENQMPPNSKKLFVPNLILSTYFQTYEQKLANPNLEWNARTGKFLFLNGKPHFPNRVGLLYLFYSNDLLKDCEYSFFANKALFDQLHKLLPALTTQQAQLFLDSVARNPDNIDYVENQGYAHYGGWPFDGELYAKTSFRVISETWRQNIPWVTEKTYITILNRHPFILAATPGTLAQIQSLGFRTFTQYLPVPDYDTIPDTDLRWQAVLENTKFWLHDIHQHESAIRQDIEYNYQHLMWLSQQIKSQFADLVRELGDPDYNTYRLIDLHDNTDDWMKFYYRVKDPSWPDCYHHNQFHLLPEHIQRECVEVFNYQPRT